MISPYTLRIDELLVQNEVSSYRRVHRLLNTKDVRLNGVPVTSTGTPVNTKTDILTIDGAVIPLKSHVYLMMNKPQDTVCTDTIGWHSSVFRLVNPQYMPPNTPAPLHSIGRLDLDTEGLLVLTTDGKLSHRLTDPQSHCSKTYLVYLKNECSEQERTEYIQRFNEGLYLPPLKKSAGFTTKSAKLEWTDDSSNPYCTLSGSRFTTCMLTITEGKFHQVKRMFAALGNEVIFLKRTAISSLFLDSSLKPGEYRPLTETEITKLEISS